MADDIQSQIDDIVSRLDDSDMSLEDFSSNLSDSLDSVQNNLDENTQSIDELSQTSGQLTFPLSQDTIDLITEQSPTIIDYLYQKNYIGTASLVAGVATVTNNLVSAGSIIMISTALAGGTQGNLSYVASAGSFVITSSSNTDTSTIIYFIIN